VLPSRDHRDRQAGVASAPGSVSIRKVDAARRQEAHALKGSQRELGAPNLM
jgi:hypothetical protein